MTLALLAGTVTFLFTTVLTIAGVGAAFILIPVFLAMGIPLMTAMSISLLLNAVAMIIASISYAKEKLIVWKSAIPILIAATILSPLGSITAKYLPETLLKWLFVGFLLFAAAMMLFYKAKEKTVEVNTNKDVWYGVGIGSLAGYIGGLLGVGGGNIIVPVLVWMGFNPKKASATTAFIVIFSSLSGFFGRVSMESMDLTLLSWCTLGSVGGALLGAWLMSKKLSSKNVKLIIGIILFFIAFKMIWDLLKW
jgi:hypothetical protein